MTIFLTYIPFVISFAIGVLSINLLFNGSKNNDFLLKLCLGGLLGLGISSFLTFSSFVFFNQYLRAYIVILHILIFTTLFFTNKSLHKQNKTQFLSKEYFKAENFTLLGILCVCLIPSWIQANYYPHGGWDAWSTWNFKAKFLLLSGTDWKNMFEPVLWRSSPMYPLFLPSVNVWGWTFINKPVYQVPLMTTFLYTALVHGLLLAGLKRFIKTPLAILAVTTLLTIELYIKMSTSQYCDVIVASYLLAAVLMLIFTRIQSHISFSILAGMLTGFLSFTKAEGYVTAFLLVLLSIPYLLWRNPSKNKHKLLFTYLFTSLIAFIPTALFLIFLAPKSTTFINGLTSAIHPSTIERLQFILAFYLFKLKSAKWGYVWIALLVGLILSKGKSLQKEILIIPLLLTAYGIIFTFYYFLNTYFQIGWWLQVSLDRILSVILPTVFFWTFYSVWQISPSEPLK